MASDTSCRILYEYVDTDYIVPYAGREDPKPAPNLGYKASFDIPLRETVTLMPGEEVAIEFGYRFM